MTRTREEHIKWMKERAIAEMDYYKDPSKGIVSIMSDLGKHPETNSDTLRALCMMQLMKGVGLTRQDVITFADGFN